MSDDRDLRALAGDLLADPPHPAPHLDELERRVSRRRQRRARAIGACSILAVVLVTTAVLALPRDQDLQVGDGTTATPTTQPPPPLGPSEVQLIVTPQSATAETPRSIVQRNTGSEPYDACGKVFDLFRWDGAEWNGVASNVAVMGGELILGDFDPSAARRSMETAQCVAATPVAPGADVTVGEFQPSHPRRHAAGGTVPARSDPLVEGWYELRQIYVYDDEPSLGRFEITPPGSDTEPPPSADASIELAVNPTSAPLAAVRTLEVTNRSSETYSACGADGKPGLAYDLHRWDGSAWQPIAAIRVADDPPVLVGYSPVRVAVDCETAVVAEPGGSTKVHLALGRSVNQVDPSTTTGQILAPGWYELRNTRQSWSNLTALGRFEITDATPLPPTASTVTTTGDPPTETVDGISVSGSVDVWPGGPGILVGQLLPDELIAIDDDTVALAWPGPCNRPADRLDVVATEHEVEVRLHVTTTLEVCGDDAPNRWVLTTDLGGIRIGTRRLVARAVGSDREVEVPAAESIRAAALTETSTFPGAMPISFQVPSDFFGGAALLTIPAPLLTSDHACAVATYDIDRTFIPVVRMGPPLGEPDVESCSNVAVAILPDDRLFGTG